MLSLIITGAAAAIIAMSGGACVEYTPESEIITTQMRAAYNKTMAGVDPAQEGLSHHHACLRATQAASEVAAESGLLPHQLDRAVRRGLTELRCWRAAPETHYIYIGPLE